jgi:hypothetical protein
VEIEWPNRRAGVIEALDVLESDPATLLTRSPDGVLPYPSLTDAVHWLVDDTSWDHHDPSESVGTILSNLEEADAITSVVKAIVRISGRQGATASDAVWLADSEWQVVRESARVATELLRRGDEAQR